MGHIRHKAHNVALPPDQTHRLSFPTIKLLETNRKLSFENLLQYSRLEADRGVIEKKCQNRKNRLYPKRKRMQDAGKIGHQRSTEKHREKQNRKTASQAQYNVSPVASGGQRQNRSLILQVGREAWVKRHWQSYPWDRSMMPPCHKFQLLVGLRQQLFKWEHRGAPPARGVKAKCHPESEFTT